MASHHPSDEALVEGLRAGRKDAFRRLYDEHHPAIYNLCARILSDREEAKDVTQETFIAAFASPPPAGSSLRAWLYRVATNACFNQIRSRRTGGGVVEEAAAPVDEFARAETVAAVEQTLGQLNERYRTALVLKDLHGLPPEEIAEVMEISRPNADVLVHRARASFKAAFAKLGGDVPAPANLGLVLAPLSVPAALHVMPPLPHVGAPVHPVPPHLAHLAQQPPDGGLLAKLATAASAKIAIGAAAASLLVAGGALEVAKHKRPQHSTKPLAATALTSSIAPATSHQQSHDRSHDEWGHHWRRTHDWYEHMREGDTWSGDHWVSDDSSGTWSDAHAGDSHAAGSSDSSSSGSHDSSSGSHDSSGSWSSGSSGGEWSTSSSDGHDSGDGDHSGSGW